MGSGIYSRRSYASAVTVIPCLMLGTTPFTTHAVDQAVIDELAQASGQDIRRSLSISDLTGDKLFVNTSGAVSEWSNDGFGNTAGMVDLTLEGAQSLESVGFSRVAARPP